MIWRVLLFAATLTLAACAAPSQQPAEPRSLSFAAEPSRVFETGISMFMERGYVIRHADADLARAEAVAATWPGYRVSFEVTPEGEHSRVTLSGRRDDRPLPPQSLDPLLVDLQARLGLAP